MKIVSTLASYSVYPLAAIVAVGVAGCISGRINIKDYLPSFLMHDRVSLEGRPYLHHCADAGNYYWLCFFFTCGRTDANGRDKNENDDTLLNAAVRCGHYECIPPLLRAGARVSPELMIIAAVYYPESLKFLLKDWKGDLEAKDTLGDTLLMSCVKGGSSIAVQALLEAGARVDVVDPEGNTPLHLVCQNAENLKMCLKLLIEAGADPNAKNKLGQSPLHLASESMYPPVVEGLIKAGSALEALDHNGQTPLQRAALRGVLKNCELLVQNGADYHVIDTYGRSLSHLASIINNYPFLKFARAIKAMIEPRDLRGRTPLHYAGFNYDPACIWYLVFNNADIEALDQDGCTPLHLATISGFLNENSVPTLLSLGAKIEAQDKSGKTPLHHAVRNLNLNAVTHLINRGANVFATTKLEDTPLHTLARTIPKNEAEEHKIASIFRAISAAATGFTSASNQGGDLVNKEGFTPLILALVLGNEIVRKLFEQRNGRIKWTRNDLISLTNGSRGFQNL